MVFTEQKLTLGSKISVKNIRLLRHYKLSTKMHYFHTKSSHGEAMPFLRDHAFFNTRYNVRTFLNTEVTSIYSMFAGLLPYNFKYQCYLHFKFSITLSFPSSRTDSFLSRVNIFYIIVIIHACFLHWWSHFRFSGIFLHFPYFCLN